MLYALCDSKSLSDRALSLQEFVNLSKKNNAQIIQYRDKFSSIEDIKESLIKLRSLWDKTLIINDHIELIEYCDGVHVGQEDLLAISLDKKEAISYIRDKVGDKLIGISTHNQEEIKEANDLDLNYIGLGAYRNTSTKDVPNILGDSIIGLAALSKHPVAAIGGVKLEDKIPNVTYNVVGSGLYES